MARRAFLFLQGPHGPFFFELSRLLQTAGHDVCRIGFNRGDAHYWKDRSSYVAYQAPAEAWAEYLDDFLDQRGITDLVIYGDARARHAEAIASAKAKGLRVHCFEEGYLRPYWVTYERNGSNGNSRLMDIPLSAMEAMLDTPDAPQPDAPAQWGALWRHIFLGSIYHANILFRNGDYPNYRSHRSESVFQEWMLHCRRLLAYPWSLVQRRVSTRRLMAQGAPYHVALLQLGHDASVQEHSDFPSMRAFIETCIDGFAKGAPDHHQLVFKAHPLEDGREPVARIIRDTAQTYGLTDRVRFISGGKLGPLLDQAISAVTINSTAGQQALWRGLPLKAFGTAVYSRPELVSDQPLPSFFAEPRRPDVGAYRIYRQFLLETSQISGGYYSAAGRRVAKRLAIELMLQERDVYDIVRNKKVTPSVKLTVVSG